MAWFDIFIEFLEAKSTKAVALNWSLGDRGGRKLTVGKQWSCESVGYQGPHGAHVHGSIGVDSVPTLHVLHLCGVHVLHLQREASASHRGDWAGNRGKPGKSRGTPAPMTTHPPLPPPAMPRGSTALGLCCIVNAQHVVALQPRPGQSVGRQLSGLELGSHGLVILCSAWSPQGKDKRKA